MDLTTLKIQHCIKCDLSLTRRSIVNGRGDINSKVMLIGEAPGYKEDKLGLPFVGDSGQFLRALLRFYNIEPKLLYITNVVKCRPKGNRLPSDIEIANCTPYFIIEILRVKPKIIVLLGNTALRAYYPSIQTTISRERGRLHIYDNTVILPMYHPSYVLRNKDDESIVLDFVNDIVLLKQLMTYL